MSHNRDVFEAASAHSIENAYCHLQNEDKHVGVLLVLEL